MQYLRAPLCYTTGMSMKSFFMKKVLRAKMKNVPKEQQEMVEHMMEENPELLMTIAQEVQAEIKAGKDQMTALAAVAERHKDELQKLSKKRGVNK